VNILLFADDAVLVAESAEKLRILGGEFEGKYTNMIESHSSEEQSYEDWRRGGGEVEGGMGGVEVGGRRLEEVDEFKYLGLLMEAKGSTEKEIKNRVVKGKCWGA